jgi:hypothetical protein
VFGTLLCAGSALFTMEANLKAFMNEIKREIITKLNGLSAEVQQVPYLLCMRFPVRQS